MDLLHNLLFGLHTALTLHNLAFVLVGALIGTLIGVLPALGPVATIAMLLPVVQALDAIPALIMLAGVYYGAQYGGSTAAILINQPGQSSSAVTTLDGYQLACQGRAGPALTIAALGSFTAGCVSTLIVAWMAEPLIVLSFRFGDAERFALLMLGLVGAVVLASGSLIKALGMIVLGLLLGQVHGDPATGTARFGFGLPALMDAEGIGFVVIAMGIFALGEIVATLGHAVNTPEVQAHPLQGLWPRREELRQAWPAVLRGTGLGALLGVLPGGGALLASFAAYAVEKRVARDPSAFGKGAIQGVAGPESANNAGAQTSFIPMLMLGVPPNAVMALMIGALLLKGVQPGPQLMGTQPALFWGLIASMWVGNLMLLVLNLPLLGVWTRLLTLPYRRLYPAMVALCCVGVYTLHHDVADLYLLALFAFVGYALHKLGCEPAPLLMGYILAPMLEQNLRGALLQSQGDWGIFLRRPLSAGLLLAAALLVLLVLLPSIRLKREEAFQDD